MEPVENKEICRGDTPDQPHCFLLTGSRLSQLAIGCWGFQPEAVTVVLWTRRLGLREKKVKAAGLSECPRCRREQKGLKSTDEQALLLPQGNPALQCCLWTPGALQVLLCIRQ
jgi:hypothetical protein